jgi:hypothetical protein
VLENGKKEEANMKAKPKKAKASPTVVVDPKEPRIGPPGAIHAPGKGKRGFVNFNASRRCTLLFTNPKVFGHPFTHLSRGDNRRFVKIERGHTFVMIAGCEYTIPRSLGAASSPTDIIVP